MKLFKALLSLAHENADVERGFSINRKLLEVRNSLNIESLNGIRQIKSHIKSSDNINKFEITPQVRKSVRGSWRSYQDRLAATSKVSEKRKANEESSDVERLITEEELTLTKQMEAAQKMLSNAESSIESGIKQSDLVQIESGKILLTEAKTRIGSVMEKIEINRQAQRKLKMTKCIQRSTKCRIKIM